MKAQHIRKVINSVRQKGIEVTVDSVIVESLFHTGGTLTEQDSDDIQSVFWQIRDEIERRVDRTYKGGIAGLAYGIAVNEYFNR